MFRRRNHRRGKLDSRRILRAVLESLEERTLFSAAAIDMHSDMVFLHPAANTTVPAADIQGYTPAQISQAYNFNKTSLNGAGQTIALVDAYNDPNVAADLKVFDTQFDLSAPPSLKVVNQSGGSTLPTTDAGWAGEIALDVEWAHAMAPGANILLVEATTDSLTNLMTAVNYARNAPGVSVVSMSWGGNEFFAWSNGEFTGQTQYDGDFTTPAGHQGVTFVAAAGDSGVFAGVQWPASSPNVIAVGGTSLYLNSDNSYNTETSWSGTSGGFSQVENEPTYQDVAQDSGVRTTPDVAYVGDPNTGLAVYDSVAYQGYVGWQEVGGTSAGSPQWAAIIAIANESRANAGEGTLDGPSQTLPALYGLYSSPGTTGYSTYTNYFNDVIDTTRGGRYHWRFGGFGNNNPAAAGYDTATGLGSPHVDQIVTALTNVTSTGTTSTGGTGGTGGTGTGNPQQLPASQLDSIFANMPASAISGATTTIRLRVTNTSGAAFIGPIGINLYASTNFSTDSSSLSSDTFLATISVPNLTLAPNQSHVVLAKVAIPASLSSGKYYLVSEVNELSFDTAPAITASPTQIAIAAPFVDLAATYAAAQGVRVNPGHEGSVVITITNEGNVAASGTLGLLLYASSTQTLDTTTAAQLASISGRTIHIAPNHSIRVRLTFEAPQSMPAGSYFLIATATTSTQPADSNAANNTVVISTR